MEMYFEIYIIENQTLNNGDAGISNVRYRNGKVCSVSMETKIKLLLYNSLITTQLFTIRMLKPIN